ncbi:MAG: hypothetical protein Q9220_006401 [cf. Caloplaca sp. 1 TL-2023]
MSYVLAGASLVPRLTTLATPVVASNITLAPRYDYEPGDTLNRTMCFCSGKSDLDQSDADPFVFNTFTFGDEIKTVYDYDYYNHRLDKTVRLTTDATCPFTDSKDDSYIHNACWDWRSQKADYCANFVLKDLPLGVSDQDTWRFCYLNRGDELDDPSKRDFFKFNGAERAIPRKRDWWAESEAVESRCERRCGEVHGVGLLRTKYGGWFNRWDGFKSFDDICTKGMECDNENQHKPPTA